MNTHLPVSLGVSFEMFTRALRRATDEFAKLSQLPAWRKWHTEHEAYLRRVNRASARSRRNQPGPWGQKLPYYDCGGSSNRKRNKHGRTGVAK